MMLPPFRRAMSTMIIPPQVVAERLSRSIRVDLDVHMWIDSLRQFEMRLLLRHIHVYCASVHDVATAVAYTRVYTRTCTWARPLDLRHYTLSFSRTCTCT